MNSSSKKSDITPVFIDVKKEPEDNEEDDDNLNYEMMTEDLDEQNMEEPVEEKFDPLSTIKVEYDADTPSTSLSTTTVPGHAHWIPVKEEIVSDEDISMDMEYESQEWGENNMNSDGDNSSISISENLDNLKQESSSSESSEESSEDDEDDDDDEDDNADAGEEEEDEEEEEDDDSSDGDDDNASADPLRRCLNILKKRPNVVLDIPEIAILLLLLIRRRRRNQPKLKLKRRRWTIAETSDRIARVNFQTKFAERRQNSKQFLRDFNMSVKTFDDLLEKVSHRIKRKDTNMRYAISPSERLAVTLRYLASGFSYTQLLHEFNIGKTTISGIVKTTTEIIWQELKSEYMPSPTKEEWLKISEKFYEKTEFPNCLGSICSKYIKVIIPKSKESEFDRHQKYFATAILAIVDADMRFIDISVGVLGNSNDNFLVKSTIGQKITRGVYRIPGPKPLSGIDAPPVPYVFVSKDSLNTNIMKPFSKTSEIKKQIFNCRLEKAHEISETCLKLLTTKWKVLRRGIGHHTYAEPTIKTLCILHNFIIKKEGMKIDVKDSWLLDGVPSCGMRGTASANQVREHFMNYFVSSEGSVPWQYLNTKSNDEMDESNTEANIQSESKETSGREIETLNSTAEAIVMDRKDEKTHDEKGETEVVGEQEMEKLNSNMEANVMDTKDEEAENRIDKKTCDEKGETEVVNEQETEKLNSNMEANVMDTKDEEAENRNDKKTHDEKGETEVVSEQETEKLNSNMEANVMDTEVDTKDENTNLEDGNA